MIVAPLGEGDELRWMINLSFLALNTYVRMFIVYLFVFNPFVTLQSVPSDATIWDATQSVTSKSLNCNNLKKKQAPLHEQAPVTLRLVPTGVSDVCSSSRHFSLLKAYWLVILHRWELPSDWLFHCCPLLLMLSYWFVGVSHDSFRPHLHLPNKVSVELERWLLESITSPKSYLLHLHFNLRSNLN